MNVRHLDLFAGIGGFSRAVEWLGGETVAFVEWEAWNRRVLAKHWPGAQFYGDIRAVTDDDLRALGHIDLITGGYPCQPFSLAGQRRGHEDDRHLWPEMRRVIDTLRPRVVLAENVAGHISMGLDTVLADLEADGYTCGAVVVPAGAVNALHRRDRVWIMAHANEGDAGQSSGEDQPGNREAVQQQWGGLRHEPRREGAVQPVAHAGHNEPQAELQPVSHRPEHPSTGNGSAYTGMADTTARGLRRGIAPGEAGQPARGGEVVAGTNSHGVGLKGAPQRHDPARELGREDSPIPRPGRVRQTDEAPRTLDPRPDGIRPGLVRRATARSPEPDRIRQAWADGSWESDLPRVVSDEPERRQKLMAAGNAIVPICAYEILSVMLGDKA